MTRLILPWNIVAVITIILSVVLGLECVAYKQKQKEAAAPDASSKTEQVVEPPHN